METGHEITYNWHCRQEHPKMVQLYKRGIIHNKLFIPLSNKDFPYEAVYGIKPHRQKITNTEEGTTNQSDEEENYDQETFKLGL